MFSASGYALLVFHFQHRLVLRYPISGNCFFLGGGGVGEGGASFEGIFLRLGAQSLDLLHQE